MSLELENKNDFIHKQAVRLILEEVTYEPTKLIFVKEDSEWTREADDFEETYRAELRGEEVFLGDSERAEATFDHAVFRLKNKALVKCQRDALVKAVAYGFTQPEAEGLDKTALRNIVSEITHSMNRKGLVINNDVDPFIADLYAEMKI